MKNGKWSKKQKKAFIKIQEALSDLGISNIEVAEMFTTFTYKEEVFTLFEFTTGRLSRELTADAKKQKKLQRNNNDS